VRRRLSLGALNIGDIDGWITIEYAGRVASIGKNSTRARATVHAPEASLRLRSSAEYASIYLGQYVARRISVSRGGRVRLVTPTAPPSCGNGILDAGESCDPPSEAACPGQCDPNCACL
jgi:hypothetical protein